MATEGGVEMKPPQTARWVRVAASVAVPLVGTSCVDFDGFDHGPVTEDRGPQLASNASSNDSTPVVWTVDGSELVYLASDPTSGVQSLVAVRLDSLEQRTLDRAPSSGTALARSADGSALYFVGLASDTAGDDTEPSYELREAISGRSIATESQPHGAVLVLSPDGRRLLYSAEQGDLVLDLEEGISLVTSCGVPGSNEAGPVFSPAGDQLLCRSSSDSNGGGGELVTVDVATGDSQALTGVWPETDLAPHAARWDADGVELAGWTRNPPGIRIANPSTSWVFSMAGLNGGRATALGLYEYSPDGGMLAFWVTECLASEGFLSCSLTESRLTVLDLGTGVAQTVASGEPPVGTIAFSDDSHQIAYQYGADLHVRPTGH